MSYLRERVSYLKGLAEGMQISDATNEGKLLKAIIDVLDDVSLTVDELAEEQEELSNQIDEIDADLEDVEDILYDDEEDDEVSCYATHIECPFCNVPMDIDENMIDEENMVHCPNCHKEFEVECDCDCGCDCGCEDEDEED